jgi:hypothetical protein
MSDLIERYLNAIRPLLPGDQKDDITAELRDEIRSQIEEKESELGRGLKPAEIEAILKAMGSPLTVAARYGQGRHLIGPAVYPVYMLALRIVLSVVVAAEIIGLVVKASIDTARGEPLRLAARIGEAWGDLWVSGFFMVGLITVIAAIVERNNPDLRFDWKPSRLPRPSRPKGARPQSRVESAFGFVVHVLAVLWLLGYLEAPGAYPDDLSPERWAEKAGLMLAPVWWQGLFALALLSFAAQAVHQGVMFVWPTSQRRKAAAKLVANAAGVVLAAALVQAGPLFRATAPLASSPKVAEVLLAVNTSVRLSFAVVGAILFLTALVQLWRLFGPRRPLAPASA